MTEYKQENPKIEEAIAIIRDWIRAAEMEYEEHPKYCRENQNLKMYGKLEAYQECLELLEDD